MKDMPFLVVVVVAGAGAAGKTTLANSFAKGIPVETKITEEVPTAKGVRAMSGTMTVYDNYAHVGNHKSGTDACTGPGIQCAIAWRCAEVRDIIMIDGYTSSPQWVDLVNELYYSYDVVVLFVTFDVPLEELVRRMAGRRGCTVEDMHNPLVGGNIVQRITAGMDRPARLRQHFHNKLRSVIPLYDCTITGDMSVQESVDMLNDSLCAIFGDAGFVVPLG